MSAKKASDPHMPPVVRFAPPGELRIFSVYEHELDRLSSGSPASLLLNFALFFLGVASSAAGTLYSAPPTQDRLYYTFLIVFVVCIIAGVVLGVLWAYMHRSTTSLVDEIKKQMPPNPGIQEVASESEQAGG